MGVNYSGLARVLSGEQVHVVEEAAIQQRYPEMEPLVLDERYSWIRQRGLHAAKEYDHLRFYRWTYWIFDLIAFYGMVKYKLWYLLTRPKGRDRLALDRHLLVFGLAHPLLKVAHAGVTSWTALAVLYAAKLVAEGKRGFSWLVFRFWMFHPECQAVRNRLLEVANRVYDELVCTARSRKEISIASFACGSAAAVLWATWFFLQENPNIRVRVALVDLDRYSLWLAEKLAKKLGISVELYNMKISEFIDQCCIDDRKFALVDETGFLDYRPDADFVDNCSSVRSVVEEGGLFLAAQVDATRTEAHRKWTIGWLMLIPRSREKFIDLLVQSGYDRFSIDVYTEPHGIYHVASCRVSH